MSILCNICGKTKRCGMMIIHPTLGPHTMVCDECFMEIDGYAEEMRGCGCGGSCK